MSSPWLALFYSVLSFSLLISTIPPRYQTEKNFDLYMPIEFLLFLLTTLPSWPFHYLYYVLRQVLYDSFKFPRLATCLHCKMKYLVVSLSPIFIISALYIITAAPRTNLIACKMVRTVFIQREQNICFAFSFCHYEVAAGSVQVREAVDTVNAFVFDANLLISCFPSLESCFTITSSVLTSRCSDDYSAKLNIAVLSIGSLLKHRKRL